MVIEKKWAMPNSNTFDIKPIGEFIAKYNLPNIKSVDPFANTNKIALITNDLSPDYGTTFNMDALDFLKSLKSNSVELMLFDPPYSARQVAECYKKLGRTVNMQTTQSSFWGNLKKEIQRVVTGGGMYFALGGILAELE